MQLSRFLAAASALAAAEASVQTQTTSLSPITRVVKLLEGISKRVEADGEKEEDLFETFVCWAKSIISQKTASNADAQSRVDYLASYIDDLKNGRVELTTERVDLEKEIETLTNDIEEAERLRAKEKGEFDSAEEEMNAAITALKQAIGVLSDATKDHKKGVLLSMDSAAGNAARVQEAASLHRAVELGKKVLSKGDSVFLQALLTGEAPPMEGRASWKKLNRKATFKMSYKARSGKIQDVLAELLETFKDDLKAATDKEGDAQTTFDKLMKSKNAEKDDAQTALAKMDEENGAKADSLAKSQEEFDALSAQIKADDGYIEQVKKALADKKAEWKDRKQLRKGEIAAISKAISILYSDDARDLFKRSLDSQGFLFLQERAETQSHRGHLVAATLRAVADKSHNARLVSLAKLASKGHFDEVKKAINEMVANLKGQREKDLEIKERCEKDRAEDTREAIKTSRKMDELTEDINALEAKIAEWTQSIKEKVARMGDIEKELVEIKEQRDKENKEYENNKADDKAAAGLVISSKEVLEAFYKENDLMFAQTAHRQPFESEDGKAPPPPPSTWKTPYGGKTEEQTGIIAIMEMIHEDILSDIAKADQEEAAAVALYKKTKDDLSAESTELSGSVDEMTTSKSGAIEDVQAKKKDRSTQKGELGVVMKTIADAAPNCDYFAINFEMRAKNRDFEMDGLNNALAILSGGVFSSEDPDRELKPGDAALVQSNLRGKVQPH